MDTLLQNARLALRSLRRTPGFALTAILSLALGIGLATAVFTVANALLLRRLPVRDQDRIVVLWGESRDKSFDNFPLGIADAREFARRARALERVAFFTYEGAWPVPIRDAGRMARWRRALVSGDFFGVLGVEPVLGRALRADDDIIGASPVVVLSYRAWRQYFGGDSSVLGRRIVLHGTGVGSTIVGVMPQGITYPLGTDFWAPITPSRTKPGTDSTFAHVDVIGRLRPGATPAHARDELTTFFGRAEASPWERDFRGVVHALPGLILGDTRSALIAFATAAGLLLLITCINVANLLLVRGLTRVREIAVRAALGAGRTQVIGQLLTENTLLALAGGVAGLGVAAGAVRLFVAFAPAGVPRLDEIQVNATVLAGAMGITGIAVLLFGLWPAVITSRVELERVLRSDTRQSAGRRSRLATEGLVAGQVALALLVLSAAGLIARSLIKLEGAELSFQSSNLLIGELAWRYDQYGDPKKQLRLLERLLPQLNAVPGVRAASPVVAIPFSGTGGWDGKLAVEGQSSEEAAANPMLNMEVVTPAYFETLDIPVLRGRHFTDQDRAGAPPVAMVSQSVARHFWPHEDPIGKRLRIGPELEHMFTVVGIVPETRYRELRDARPAVYFPLLQSFFPFMPMNLAIRTSGPPAELVPAIRRAIDGIEPGVALASATPFETFLKGPLAQPRLNALLLGVFAVAAVTLAAVGLFGTMATMVRQRTRELGVRLALGATGRDLLRMVMTRGLAIATGGVVVGLLAALLTNRLLVAMLYEVSPTDGVTLGVVAVLVLSIAALASVIPARSSTRIDPVAALRADG